MRLVIWILVLLVLAAAAQAVTFENGTNLNYANVTYKFNNNITLSNFLTIYSSGIIFGDDYAINISMITNDTFINNSIDGITELYNNYSMLANNSHVTFIADYNTSPLRLFYDHNWYNSSSNFTALNYSVNWFVADLNYTYNYSTPYLNQTVLFTLNVSYVGDYLNKTTAAFYYDNLNLTSNIFRVVYPTYILFQVNATSNSTGVKNFDWNVSMDSYDRSFNITGNVTVASFSFFSCSSNGNVTLNISIFDENFPANYLTADVDVEIIYWISDEANASIFNVGLEDNSTYYICLDPANETYHANLYFIYNSTNGFTHRYYSYGINLSNTTTNITMYNFNSQGNVSDVKLTIRDHSYNILSDVVGKLQRRYVDEGVWRTVQMYQSGDFGLVLYNVLEETTDYRLLFSDRNNCILDSTDVISFYCIGGLCEMTVMLNDCEAGPIEVDLNLNYDYNNDTGIIAVNWENLLGNSESVRTVVTKETLTGTVAICDVTQIGAAGTYNCNTSAYQGNVLVTLYESGSPRVSEWVKLNIINLGSKLSSKEAAFWGFLLMVLFIFMGLVHPALTLFMGIIGLIFAIIIGIFNPLTVGMIIIGIILGTIIGYKVR